MRNILFITIILLNSCASITPEAQRVTVHSQASNLLNECKRLGNVSATVNGWTKASWDEAQQQAKNDIRDKAYREMGADTVAIVNSDIVDSLLTVQGVAFRCEVKDKQKN